MLGCYLDIEKVSILVDVALLLILLGDGNLIPIEGRKMF